MDVSESRGAAPDLGRHPARARVESPSTASTLKFEKVAPPISGSLISAPSMANVASTPRCPLIANCCREVRGAISVGHGAGRQQKHVDEVALIEREVADSLA